MRSFLKSLGGRAGNKTHSRGRVNTKANKRAASKAVRRVRSNCEIQGYCTCVTGCCFSTEKQ